MNWTITLIDITLLWMNKGKYCKLTSMNISHIWVKIRKGPPSLQEREIIPQTLKKYLKNARELIFLLCGPADVATFSILLWLCVLETKDSDQT